MPSSNFRREIVSGADRRLAWATLTDVQRIAAWVSIVGDVTEISPMEQYRAVLADRVGPFKLRADLDVRVPELVEGQRIRITAAGEDRQVSSRIAIDATLLLQATDGTPKTRIVVEGRYEVTGRVASMGGGIISQKAEKILEQFFDRAAVELS